MCAKRKIQIRLLLTPDDSDLGAKDCLTEREDTEVTSVDAKEKKSNTSE